MELRDADGPTTAIRISSGFNRVRIDGDDAVQYPHRTTGGGVESVVIELVRVVEVLIESHGRKVADVEFVHARVESGLGAEV